MTNPIPYVVNQDGVGQAVYATHEPGPGVTTGMHVGDHGDQAYLVPEPGRGAVPVWFENGAPPGSPQWVAQEVQRQQQEYAAWAASHADVPAHESTSGSPSAEWPLLLFP